MQVMCVRTAPTASGCPMSMLRGEPPPSTKPSSASLTRAKEKYMRLHDEMLEREETQRRDEEEEEAKCHSGDDDDVLATVTRVHKKFEHRISRIVSRFQESKAYK